MKQMRNAIAITAVIALSSSAFALGNLLISTGESLNLTTVEPTVSAAGTTANSDAQKEVFAAAQDDAAAFIAADGQIEKSAALQAGFAEIAKIKGAEILNEVEQAKLLIILSK